MSRELREHDASSEAGDRLALAVLARLDHRADADLATKLIRRRRHRALLGPVGRSPERRTAQMEGQVRVAPGVNTPTRSLVDRDAAVGGPGEDQEHHDEDDGTEGGDSADDEESDEQHKVAWHVLSSPAPPTGSNRGPE